MIWFCVAAIAEGLTGFSPVNFIFNTLILLNEWCAYILSMQVLLQKVHLVGANPKSQGGDSGDPNTGW